MRSWSCTRVGRTALKAPAHQGVGAGRRTSEGAGVKRALMQGSSRRTFKAAMMTAFILLPLFVGMQTAFCGGN